MDNKLTESAYDEMLKIEFELSEVEYKLRQAKKVYNMAKMNECIEDILQVQSVDGSLTERDLRIFISDLVTHIR